MPVLPRSGQSPHPLEKTEAAVPYVTGPLSNSVTRFATDALTTRSQSGTCS